ncbi:hypothetical protein [Paenibacillus sp. BC26]|uniref:hypothetical protein n=1 Tax=Paenibacillus sp. BC26 TaxID=1881032 RepID=UPI0008EEC518|nr:hypothetical protein [Paenibacillus sp. BC26]SFS77670.1 hypothetical protein SAMN05428962_2799 [Paenibacillus sp. BC26]
MIKMEINLIELKKIRSVYLKQVSEKAIETRKRIFKASENQNSVLTVQKDPIEDVYWLIDNDEDYLAYCRMKGKELVYCVITPFTSETSQKIDKLKMMNMSRQTKWIDRYRLINELKEEMPLTEIAQRSGVVPSELNEYQFHAAIPDPYIKIAEEKDRNHTIYNKIAKLQLGGILSEHLYRRATLIGNDGNRLKHSHIMQITRMVKMFGFDFLKEQDQITLLDYTSSYQTILDKAWQDAIVDRINNNNSFQNEFFNYKFVNIQRGKRKRVLKEEKHT